jgi:uncharacterized membrane protein
MHKNYKKLLFVLILLHLAMALPLAYTLNIWSDEASTLYTTENGLIQTFQNVFADEKQAPLYFLLLSGWREISHSIFFARLFSIIFSLLAIKFFFELARKIFDEKAGALITAFFALHPFLIWASLEIRVYSLVVLFSVLLLKFWFEVFFRRANANGQRRDEILFVLTAIAALYTNYYLGFLLAGAFPALVAGRKWRAARRYFLLMTIVGIAILPLLWMIKAQLTTATGDVQTERTFGEGLRLIWNAGLNFVLPTEIFPPENLTVISLVRVWLVRLAILAGAVLLIKRRKLTDENILAFGTLCAIVCAFLLLAYFLLGNIYVEIRHAAVLFPPLVLFVALVLRAVLTPGREDAKTRNLIAVLAFGSTVLIAGLFAYSIYTLYPDGAKRGDWARVAAYIQQNEKPNQPIIVFTVFDALSLPYHYRGVNRILPDERFFNWGIEGEFGTAESLKSETDFAISKIPFEADEIWLATGERCLTTKACEPLENFVQANYTIIEEKDFYKEKIRLLRKKQR